MSFYLQQSMRILCEVKWKFFVVFKILSLSQMNAIFVSSTFRCCRYKQFDQNKFILSKGRDIEFVYVLFLHSSPRRTQIDTVKRVQYNLKQKLWNTKRDIAFRSVRQDDNYLTADCFLMLPLSNSGFNWLNPPKTSILLKHTNSSILLFYNDSNSAPLCSTCW